MPAPGSSPLPCHVLPPSNDAYGASPRLLPCTTMLAASRSAGSVGLAATADSAWSPSSSWDTCTAAAGRVLAVVVEVVGDALAVGGVLRCQECSVQPPPITAARLRPVAASVRVCAVESRIAVVPSPGLGGQASRRARSHAPTARAAAVHRHSTA